MSKENIKIRFLESRGSPVEGGVIIQKGTVADFPAYWAKRFIADGTAEVVKAEKTKTDSDKKGKK